MEGRCHVTRALDATCLSSLRPLAITHWLTSELRWGDLKTHVALTCGKGKHVEARERWSFVQGMWHPFTSSRS
jgi:hypothetical protein